MKNEKIKYFSMFTGVGGFELGLENAGSKSNLQEGWNENSRSPQSLQREGDKSSTAKFSCVGFSEIDKYASELLATKFPTVKNYGDATKINPRELPDFDMLCGGFPCQAFSVAGKRRGFEDTRGTMFFEIARILEVKRPKIVFLENVKGLLNHEGGKTFTTILQTLDELGYEVQWMVLNSKFFGVPQNRERVFIIASLRGEPRPEILPFGQGNKINNEQSEKQTARCLSAVYYKQEQWEQYIQQSQGQRIYTAEGVSKTLSDGGGSTEDVEIHQMNNPTHSFYRVYGENGISPAMRSSSGNKTPKIVANCVTPDAYLQSGRRKRVDGKAVLTSCHERRIRRLTPIECERLQGFPDGWTEGFSDTQRYKMMGNAVTVNVIKAIGEKLK